MPVEREIATVQTVINRVIEFCVDYSFQVIGGIHRPGGRDHPWQMGCQRHRETLRKKGVGRYPDPLPGLGRQGGGGRFALVIALSNFGITITPFVAAVGAAAFGESAVDIGFRHGVSTQKYIETMHAVNGGLSGVGAGTDHLPFPQRVVTMAPAKGIPD